MKINLYFGILTPPPTMEFCSVLHTSFDLGISHKPSPMHVRSMRKCFKSILWILTNAHGVLFIDTWYQNPPPEMDNGVA